MYGSLYNVLLLHYFHAIQQFPLHFLFFFFYLSIFIFSSSPATTMSLFSYFYSFLYNNLPCEDKNKCLAFAPMIVTIICELLINGFFTYLDIYQFKSTGKYRINYCTTSLGSRKYPTKDEIFHGFKIFSYGYLRIILPLHLTTLFLSLKGILKNSLDTSPTSSSLSDLTIFSHLIFCVIFADCWNYTIHRIMHIPYFYARFHRLHHEYLFSFVWVNHAFHDLEILLYGISVVVPPLLLNSHIIVSWMWAGLTIFHTAYQHSGYSFPFLQTPVSFNYFYFIFFLILFYFIFIDFSNVFHDAHHYLVNKNFSAHTPFLDMFFGTYAPNQLDDRYLKK